MVCEAGEDECGDDIVERNPKRPFRRVGLLEGCIERHDAGDVKGYGDDKRQGLRLGDGGGDEGTDMRVRRAACRRIPDGSVPTAKSTPVTPRTASLEIMEERNARKVCQPMPKNLVTGSIVFPKR